jgi:hypothetical protein
VMTTTFPVISNSDILLSSLSPSGERAGERGSPLVRP